MNVIDLELNRAFAIGKLFDGVERYFDTQFPLVTAMAEEMRANAADAAPRWSADAQPQGPANKRQERE